MKCDDFQMLQWYQFPKVKTKTFWSSSSRSSRKPSRKLVLYMPLKSHLCYLQPILSSGVFLHETCQVIQPIVNSPKSTCVVIFSFPFYPFPTAIQKMIAICWILFDDRHVFRVWQIFFHVVCSVSRRELRKKWKRLWTIFEKIRFDFDFSLQFICITIFSFLWLISFHFLKFFLQYLIIKKSVHKTPI